MRSAEPPPIKAAFLNASLTRSSLPAPIFCPIIAMTPKPNPTAGMKAKNSMRKPMEKAAAPGSQLK
jgi:hypothetical protein